MSCWRLVVVSALFFSSTPSCLTAQAVPQELGKPLFPPNLVVAGGPLGTGNILVGFNVASLPSIPFSATIEAERQILDDSGNTKAERRITKIDRDTKGRTRIDTDLNLIDAPTDRKLVTVHIYDAVTKTDLTLFPEHQVAMRYEDKPLPQPKPGKHPAPIALEPAHLGLGKPLPIATQREDLGTELIQGMQVRHGRETVRYPAGFEGHKDAYAVVTDYWYSDELQVFVLVKQVDPINGVQTLTLRDVRRENPNTSIFRVPKNYRVQ